MNRIYDLVIILENLFLVGIFQYLCIREKRTNEGVFIGIILSLESYILFYFEIPEDVKLVAPIFTLFFYSIYLTKGFKLRNLIVLISVFLNLILIKSLIILFMCFVSQRGFYELYTGYENLFLMTVINISVLGLEYFYLEHKNMSDILLPKKSSIVLIIYIASSFLLIIYIFLKYINNLLEWNICMFVILVSILLLFLTIYVCISNGVYYGKNLEQSLKLEAYDYEDKYINAITKRTAEYNKLRHDMKNHFNVLERMIENAHIQEAKEYMEQISFDQGEHCVHINHVVLNYILSSKSELAKSHGIELSCIIMGEPVTFISNVDYSILIGNLLDNAIEGTVEAGENEISLCLSFDVDKFIIEVKNCVIDKPKSKQLLTTKKDKSKHGIGLKNIKDIVDKYNGQDVIEANENVFYHMCILYRVDEK